MDMGLSVIGPLARLGMPLIQFLFVGSRLCSTLLSDTLSRDKCPCASLRLHLHQVGEGTFTPKLVNMPSTPKKDLPARKVPDKAAQHEPVHCHYENVGIQLRDCLIERRRRICFRRKLPFIFKRNFTVAHAHPVHEICKLGVVSQEREDVLRSASAKRVGNRDPNDLVP